MSVFGDFQKAWAQRFPGCELPQAWEEDVRANLMKHRQKLAALNAELEKEEFYVEYLENLLAHVERVKQNPQIPNSDCENNSSPDSTIEKINHNANGNDTTNLDNNFSSSECLQNADIENNTSKLNDDNALDQNSYITVIEVGGSAKSSQSSNSKVTDKEDTPGKSLRSDDEPEIELTSFQKKKPPAPPKKPRKSIPVQAVPPVQQNNSVNSEGLQKNEKLVIDAPVENTDNLNNSLVSSEKQDVILDVVPTTDKLSDECLETEQKNNEANSVDISSHQSDVYDDENIYDTVAPDEIETSSSHTVVSESSKEDGEGDYVVFNESYDSYPECPPVVSSRSRIAECLLNTQRSVEEESPEYATYMNIDYFLQNQKGALSKITHCESVGADSDEEDAFLGRSFSDHEVEPEHVADYSEKKDSGTSAPNDDVFEMDSGE